MELFGSVESTDMTAFKKSSFVFMEVIGALVEVDALVVAVTPLRGAFVTF